jgi:plastocyanin
MTMNQISLSRRTRRLLPIAALPLFLAAGACGGDSAAAGPSTTAGATDTDVVDVAFQDSTGQADVAIQVRDNAFVGQYVAVSAGTTVTFDNRGRNPHDVVPVEDTAFAEVPTESLQPGEAATVTFAEPGNYPYYCTLHGTETAGMFGIIRVTG